jgi:hypothetical protein
MTSTVDNARNGVNKGIILHPSIDKAVKLRQIIPSTVLIGLDRVHPIKHARDPLEFGEFLTGTNGIGSLAEIDSGISTRSTFIGRSLSQEIIQTSIIAHAGRLDGPPSPPTTSLHVGPAVAVRYHLCSNFLSRFLIGISVTGFRWIGPWFVAFIRMIPISCSGIKRRGSTFQRTRSSVPFGIGRGGNGHVRIDSTFHVFFPRGTIVILIGL